jgi:hypothetical protein
MGHIDRVQHVSFIAYRAIPDDPDLAFHASGKKVNVATFHPVPAGSDEITITTTEMYELMHREFPEMKPCAWLNGTTVYDTFKFLVTVNVGTTKHIYGNMGKKTLELVQVFYHLFFGRYFAFLGRTKTGPKIFLFSMFDPVMRKALGKYLKVMLTDPLAIFRRIYAQSIHFQQPNEIIDGKINLCDDCVNMMAYQGQLINSCRLDEYRLLGEAMTVIKKSK